MLQLSDIPRHISVAFGELHQREILGPRHNPRILAYHATTKLKATTDEIAWCSAFVCWCLEQVGIASTRSAAARSWLDWGSEAREPYLGAVAVFARGSNPAQGHVGFVLGTTPKGEIVLLGGNQANEVSVQLQDRGRLLGLRGVYLPMPHEVGA